MRNGRVYQVAIAMVGLVGQSAHAGPDACEAIRNAIVKQNAANQIQASSVSTYTDNGRKDYHDYLISGDKFYSRDRNGPWKVEPRWPTPLFVDGKPAIYDCRFAGTDRIKGTTVVVYTYKRFVPEHTMEIKAWMDADNGEFLQTETNIGPISDHKTRFTFSYNPNAAPPTVGNP